MRRAFINGAAGIVAFHRGRPFSIAEIDFLADPERIAQLDLTELGD